MIMGAYVSLKLITTFERQTADGIYAFLIAFVPINVYGRSIYTCFIEESFRLQEYS